MLQTSRSDDGEASASSSPASAHGLLSLMQSVVPPCSPAMWPDEGSKNDNETSTIAAKLKKRNAKNTKKPKKPRKRTYYMRKEELAVLSAEYAKLQTQMHKFARKSDAMEHRERMRMQQEQNREIRHVIHAQRLAFANTQSMIAQHMRVQEHSPFETFIHLGRDPVQRHGTLLAMKKRKLHDALQFLAARSRFMDPAVSFADNQKFENAKGDFCFMGFDVTPFPNIRSARTVFDVLLNFLYNLEISLSELLGDITIRENDDHWDPSVSQQRLVTNVANVAEMETNNVMFSEYYERHGPAALGVELPHEYEDLGATGYGEEMGVLACDFVNQDELYPYLPSRRIRQDVTVLMLVSTCMRPKARVLEDNSPVELERVVVLTRWSLLRVRKSTSQLPFEVSQRLRNGTERVGEAMLNNVHYALTPREPSVPSGDLPQTTVVPAEPDMLSPAPTFGAPAFF